MLWVNFAGLLFTIFPFSCPLRCHQGHSLSGNDDVIPANENVMTTVKCLEEDVFCLRAEAVTSWFTLFEASFEGAVCSNRSTCLSLEADCKSVLAEIIADDEQLSDPTIVEFSNCSWACCNDDFCNSGDVETIRKSYTVLPYEPTASPQEEATCSGNHAHARTILIATIAYFSMIVISILL